MDFKRDNENFIEMYINEPDFSGNGKRRSQRKWSIIIYDALLLCVWILIDYVSDIIL